MEQLALEAMRQDLAGDNLYFNSAGTQKRRSALNYDNCWLLFFSNWNLLDSLRENVTPDYLNLDAISSNWNKLLLWLKRITPVV